MSEFGTPPAPSQSASASTALSNTGWALSPATITACQGDAPAPAPSAGPRLSHRATITVQQRLKRGGIGWIITGRTIGCAASRSMAGGAGLHSRAIWHRRCHGVQCGAPHGPDLTIDTYPRRAVKIERAGPLARA